MLSVPFRQSKILTLHWVVCATAPPLSECICPQHKHSRDAMCWFKLFSIIYRCRLLLLIWPKAPREFSARMFYFLSHYMCNTLDLLAPITSSSKGWTQQVKGQRWEWLDGLCVLRRCRGQHNYWAFQVAERSGRMGCYQNRPSFIHRNEPPAQWPSGCVSTLRMAVCRV